MTAVKIELSSLSPFARGGNRSCYVHPDDPNKCIKVLLPRHTARVERRNAPFFKRLRPLYFFDDNLRELHGFEALERRRDPDIWQHFPRCYGLVETDLGSGIVTSLLRNADGTIAPTLKSLIQEGQLDQLRRPIEQFRQFLLQRTIVTRDLLLHNIVVVNDPSSDQRRLYMVDGLGNSDFIPAANYIRPLARAKIRRKIGRMEFKIQRLLDKEKGLPSR